MILIRLAFVLLAAFYFSKASAEETNEVPPVSPASSDTVQEPVSASDMLKRSGPKEPEKMAQPGAIPIRDTEAENIAGTRSDRGFGWRFFITVFNNTAKDAKAEGTGRFNSTPFTFTSEEKAEGAFGYSFGGVNRINQTWGFELGLGAELERELKSFSGSIDGTSFSGTYAAPRSKYSVGFLYSNAKIFLGDNLSLHLGINFSTIQIDDSTIDFEGGIGGQVGASFNFNNHFGLFVEYRSYMVKATQSDFDGTNIITLDYDEFVLSGVVLGATIQF